MKFVIADGKNQLYRMAFQPSMKALATEDGFPTGALFGCLNYSLLSVSKRLPDASFIWCWDGQGDTWRHKLMLETPAIDGAHFPEVEDEEEKESVIAGASVPMYEDFTRNMVNNSLSYFTPVQKKKSKRIRKEGYKGNRAKIKPIKAGKYPKDDKQRAILQIPVLKLILESVGIRQFEIQGLEADDLIAIVVKKIIDLDEDYEIYILSGDRDFYQLLKYPGVTIIKSIKGGVLQKVTGKDVFNQYGVKPKYWSKYRAWTGDTTDNIGHIFKVGPATAIKMLADGLDPSVPNCNSLMPTALDCAVNKYTRYFPQGIEKMWPSIHNNYKLCRLIKDPEDSLLPDDVQERLYKAFSYVENVEDFCRNKECRTSEAYRKVSYLLAKYELNSILTQRDTLWEIP